MVKITKPSILMPILIACVIWPANGGFMKFLGKIVKRVLVLMFSPLIMPLVIFDTLQAFLDGLNGDPRKVRFYE